MGYAASVIHGSGYNARYLCQFKWLDVLLPRFRAFPLLTVVRFKLFVIFLAARPRDLRFLSLSSNQDACGYEISGVKVVRCTNTEGNRS